MSPAGLARRLARAEILELEPYASAWDDEPDRDAYVKLDANESPWPPFPSASDEAPLNRYPEPQPARLRGRLAGLYGVSPERVLVTRGSDESIDLLMRVFCRPAEDAVIVCPPTFGYYAVAAAIQGASVVTVSRNERFDVDEDAVVAACESSPRPVKLVFVCSPNNPTGNATDPERILTLAKRLPHQLVVVDEAYVEFSPFESLTKHTEDTPNLVVLRTLSKAFGLAGARCGAAVAPREVLDVMRRALAPYPVPSPTVSAVCRALEPHGIALVRDRVAAIRRRRDRLARSLERCADVREVYPSDANFLLVAVTDSERVAAELHARGIRVRRFERLPGLVRISVGTEPETALLERALGLDAAEPSPPREATVSRRTNETDIAVTVRLDDDESIDVETGIGFFDHMLEQVARHGGFGTRITARGDLEIDAHHTVEDCALVLGEALREALGDKRGIERYGFVLPMDESRAEVLVDLSGRPASVFEGSFPDERVGGMATELVPHVFDSLAQSLRAAIHVRVTGENTHHMVEACFKAFGRALRQAMRRSGDGIPSTKGVL